MDHLKCLAGAFSIIFKKEGNDLKFRKCFTAILCAIVVLSVSGCGVPSQSVAEAPASTVPDERTNESMSTQTVDSMFSNLPNSVTEKDGLLQIEAVVLYPQQIASPVISYSVNYGGTQCTIEKLQNELMPEATSRNLQIVADEQNGAEQSAQIASLTDSTGNVLIGEILSYPGRFTCWMDLPDTYYSDMTDGSAGSTDFSGIAQQCEKSSDECKAIAQNLLKTIDLDISLGTVRSYAVSPDQEGRYTVGYYVVHIPQVIHGIPVSVIQNCGSSNSMTITTTATSPTGFRMRVFDSGMENVTGFWLNEQTLTPIDTYDTLLSLDGAVEVLKTWVLNNYESKPLAIREIRFEYAMVERNGQLTLVPAWSFDTLQGVPNDHFDGIQIDATNGEILRAIEEFWL